MSRRLALIAALIVAASVFPAGPASAVDKGLIGALSPDNPVIERTYTPILGVYPNARLPLPNDVPSQVPRGAEPFANFKPEMCRSANWCDTHTLDIDYPANYLDEIFFAILVTLTWDNPRTADNQTGNDLDFFLWPTDDPTSGAPSTQCRSPGTAACDLIHPEIVIVFEPEDTVDPAGTKAADQVPAMLFTVVNHTGVNTGYTIRAEFYTFDIEFGRFFLPERGGPRSSGGSGPASAKPKGFDASALRNVQGPKATRNIELPGADGELVVMDLPLIAAGAIEERVGGGGGPSALAIALAGVGALLVGLGGATVVRRRRASSL